ncbi:MATE family efflux transporter [Paenibacillus flagellatus]|uniref:MATE family efflux transporter n=1 Tax=Paenibacillus flagellatus TaxID=2211139 RepID=A0A2V5K7H4_9BACL|nr:MATE family efflux transporter [Paenibacillus flagellatus]PYI53954.1 MATE family efflux transporter [Paenibacillus flagellatus]
MNRTVALTTGPIGKTLFYFAIPFLIGNALQSLNGLVNSIWVGQLLGEQALAATSGANTLLFFLISTIFGIAMATVIMIGKRIGAEELDAAKEVVGTSAVFFLVVSVVIASVGALFTTPILGMLNTPSDIITLAESYTRILFLGIPFSFLLQFAMAVMRGAGDSKTPLYFLVFSVVLDIALNPVLILGLGPVPEFGISGSSLAAGIAQFLGLLFLLIYLYGQKYFLRITRGDLRLLKMNWNIIKFLIGKGIPMGLQMMLSTASVLALFQLINTFGSDATAAFGAVNQLVAYVQMPGIALGGALTAMAAQNIGAGRWERVNRALLTGIGINLLLTGVLVVLCTLFRDEILALFLPTKGNALAIGKQILLITLWSYILFGITLVIGGIVRATGAVVVPLLITSLSLYGIQIPLAYFFGRSYGLSMLWWSFPISLVCSALLFAGYYLSGIWKKASGGNAVRSR